jgi:hypothetical protein
MRIHKNLANYFFLHKSFNFNPIQDMTDIFDDLHGI